jgi:hypothetical protein
MADQVTVVLSLTGKVDVLTASIVIPSFSLNLATGAEADGSLTTMATTYGDLNFDAVGWDEVTWAAFKNLSSTTGEDIYAAATPELVAGMTDDGTVAGASLTNTLTAAGYYKIISANGTSQGKNWEVGDIAIYLGTSGAYAQVRPGKFAILEPGRGAIFQVATNGTQSLKFKAATGTPRLAHAVVGALA